MEGLDEAREVERIEDVTISVRNGTSVEPLPRGHRYLGFIFARAEDPADVEQALREANRRLRFRIERPH